MALIQCPECGGNVSDRAISCPHCGFPLSQKPAPRPGRPPKRKKSSENMRLPSGYGSVKYLGPGRRKPYIANVNPRLVINDSTKKSYYAYDTLGTYETRSEAVAAIFLYNQSPYDLRISMTLEELYNEWLPKYEETLSSASSIRTITAAWAYAWKIYKVKVRELSPGVLKDCIMNATLPNDPARFSKRAGSSASARTKQRIKSLFNLLFDYAEEYGIAEKNYARLFSLDSINEEVAANRRKPQPFAPSEINILWDHVGEIPFVDMILCQCYSGMRPKEICLLLSENIHLQEGWMLGGMKTQAGTNRPIPIHPKTLPLIQSALCYAQQIGSPYLFNDPRARDHPNLTYDMYNKRFNTAMERLQLPGHTPHDCRHTFITYAKLSGLDRYNIKRIVGHELNDITEKIYTHISISELISDMKKFEIKEEQEE